MIELEIFKMPKATGIAGRTSSITNAFVGAIIPMIYPTENQLKESLAILNLNSDYLQCAYCGDKATEWDHLRPIVNKKRPTGFISDIYNLVPACGKCNQSKGGRYWKDWITSNAKLSPKSRNINNLNEKIGRLEKYENWGQVKPIDYEKLVGAELWNMHWESCQKLHNDMINAQKYAKQLRVSIMNALSKNTN